MKLIERLVTIRGPLDEQQRRWLLEIADLCSVYRTLAEGTAVVTVT